MDAIINGEPAILGELSVPFGLEAASFRPLRSDDLWLGEREDGCTLLLKRSHDTCEPALHLDLSHCCLPAPHLIHEHAEDDGGGWLLLGPLPECPTSLAADNPAHWWQNAHRRADLMAALADLHARFWNQPDRIANCTELRRYTPQDWWSVVECLDSPPRPWPRLDDGVLERLRHGAERLLDGPATLVNGGLDLSLIAWSGPRPLLLDWSRAAWTSPYVDLGRLFAAHDWRDGEAHLLVAPNRRHELLVSYQDTLADNAIAVERDTVDECSLIGACWELAVEMWREARNGGRGERLRYERLLQVTERMAAEG